MSALTVAMLWVTIMSALDVSRTEGYCLYGTLLLHPHSACPVQIRAHHHIDVYTDINNIERVYLLRTALCEKTKSINP